VSVRNLGTILCPVDLSEQSQTALYHGAGFAQTAKSRLAVLRVDPRALSGNDDDALAAWQELDEFVRGTLPGWSGYGPRTELVVRGGEPPAAILAAAREFEADLIVMGTRGRGALARALLGSTTAAVLRDSRVPVAVIPRSRPELISLGESRAVFHFGLVLVPVDLCGDHTRQLEWAGQLSVGSEHHLLLVHVMPRGSDRAAAMERLNALAAPMQTARGVKLLVREGEVVDEVVRLVRHERVGLVVMGRSSDRPGAMAYEVLRSTNALVMVVP
jgi:nucleotide-binding universal stress UspA family protein